jgi:hypothetical protein
MRAGADEPPASSADANAESATATEAAAAEATAMEATATMYARLCDALEPMDAAARSVQLAHAMHDDDALHATVVDMAGVERAGAIGASVQALSLRSAARAVGSESRAPNSLAGENASGQPVPPPDGTAPAEGPTPSAAGGSASGGASADVSRPRFARSLHSFPRDGSAACVRRDERAAQLAMMLDVRLIGLSSVCGTGGAGARHAHVDVVGSLRSIARLERNRKTVGKQRRFQHALSRLMLEDDEIALIEPMAVVSSMHGGDEA